MAIADSHFWVPLFASWKALLGWYLATYILRVGYGLVWHIKYLFHFVFGPKLRQQPMGSCNYFGKWMEQAKPMEILRMRKKLAQNCLPGEKNEGKSCFERTGKNQKHEKRSEHWRHNNVCRNWGINQSSVSPNLQKKKPMQISPHYVFFTDACGLFIFLLFPL